MKYFKTALFIVLICLTFTVRAQVNNKTNDKKESSRARIEIVKGQRTLILNSGQSTIEIKVEENTWRILDSIVVGPWGGTVKLKSVDGRNVDVAKANVNSKVGLMFTSGSKCATLKKEELDALK